MIGTTLQNRYLLQAELGQGGMGIVYRAQDTLLNRPVAVKMLTGQAIGSQGSGRLLDEARAVAQLNHPNIVAVYDAGDDEAAPFIVMELVAGTDLRQHLQPAPPDLAEAVRWLGQICLALHHAHEHGIIHRDLKPTNIIVTPDQAIKLMDFGLALTRGTAAIAGDNNLAGTVNYIAPELILGRAASVQSDLYALGVIMYELVAGRPPFRGDNLVAVISQHLHAPVPPPSTYNPAIPLALDRLISQLLQKDAAERPPSAAAVAAALEQFDAVAAQPAAGEASLLNRIVRGRLVSRAAEFDRLRDLWNRSQQGRAELILISGEPGVGKTRLAEELQVFAQLRRATILRGGCYEYEATNPYLPFVEALQAWVHGHTPAEQARHLGPVAPELVKLVPEIEAVLGPVTPNPPLGPNEERLRLFDNVAHFLENLAEASGLLLFLDDLQWADNGTLALLRYLLRRLRDEKLVILGTYREVELSRAHPLAAALVEWTRQRLATRITLDRFSLADTGELLAAIFGQDSVDTDFAAAVYRETAGNPFFIEEVVKALIEQGEVYREDGRWASKAIADLAIPQSIKEAIGRRLDRLSGDCVETLQLAAIIGKTFTFAEIAAVAALAEDPLLDSLDEAAAAQLIQAQGNDSFRFTHDKIREVLYQELNPIRRRRHHLRIAQALLDLNRTNISSRVQDLAHHFIEGGDLKQGLNFALQAAEKAMRVLALAEARHFYHNARDCLDPAQQPAQLLEIDLILARIAWMRGDFDQAIAGYEQALKRAPAGEQRAAIRVRLGGAYVNAGDGATGVTHLEAAIADLDPHNQRAELAEAKIYLGRYYHLGAQLNLALEFLTDALEPARSLRDPVVLASLYGFLAGVYQHRADLIESMNWARRSIELAEIASYPLAAAHGFEFLSECSALQGRWAEALNYAAQNYEIGQRIGAQDRVAWTGFARAYAYLSGGQFAASTAAAQASIALAQTIGERRLIPLNNALVAIAWAYQGDLAAAQALAAETLAAAEELGQLWLVSQGRLALASVYAQLEQYAAVRATLDVILPRLERDLPIGLMRITPCLTQALLGLDQVDEAARLGRILKVVAHQADSVYHSLYARQIEAQVAAAQGDGAAAAAGFAAVITGYAAANLPLEQGLACYHRGRWRERHGDAPGARDDLAAAATILGELGAEPDRRRAAAALAALRPQTPP